MKYFFINSRTWGANHHTTVSEHKSSFNSPRQLRALNEHERRVVEQEIKDGTTQLIMSSPSNRGFLHNLLVLTDTRTRGAIIEGARTEAETLALERIAAGNYNLKLWNTTRVILYV